MKSVPAGFWQNVFLNCPFDSGPFNSGYRPLFRAAVFTIQMAGFTPRCAYEVRNAGPARLAKIMDIISECRFGIHDLSRSTLDPHKPRLNMPLELGLDLGCSRWGAKHLAEKRLLILDESLRRHHRVVSDLGGQEIFAHGNEVQRLVCHIRDWLSMASPEDSIPGGAYIFKRYRLFQDRLPGMCRAMKLSRRQLIFVNYLKVVRVWAQEEKDA